MSQRKKVYIARKERLLRMMPAQPMRQVRMPKEEAMVEKMSSGRLPTRIMSACGHMFDHVTMQNMKARVV